MESLSLVFVTSFFVGMSGALTPGPVLLVTITETARRGFMAGPAIALGHGLLELVTVVLLTLGLSQVLRVGMVPGLVGLLGGAFLLWMAYGMLRGAARLSLSNVLMERKSGLAVGPVVAGITASLANPYWLVWWATVGASFIVNTLSFGFLGVASFYVGHVSADLVWLSFVAGLITTGRRLMTDSVYRGIIVACAIFLVALGLFFMLSGAATIMGLELISLAQTRQ